MKNRQKGFDFRLVIIFAIVSLLLSAPFMYRAWKIHEIYLYPDVREHVLDSVFFLREDYGLTIADLTIKDVVLAGPVIHTTIHEKYHGLIDRSVYDDLEQDYVVQYSYDSEEYSIKSVQG